MKKLLHFLVLFFVIGVANAQTPIYQFDFDGNSNNSGTGTFNGFSNSGSGVISYVNNRSGQANKAINIPNNIQYNFSGSANAPSLPIGNSARTLSFWVKFIDDTDNKTYMPVGWGTSTANQAFGFWRNGVQNSYYTWGSGNDYNVPQTNAQIQAANNGWVHIAMTHTGTTLTIYYNGVDAGNYPRTLNTFGPSDLTLNRLVNNGNSATGVALQLDDLKIYNTALTGTQITSLYNTNTIGTTSMPTITSVSATNIGNTTATINYTVNANNAATTTEIRYAANPKGSLQIQAGGNASGNTPTALSVSLIGLTPNTTYDYNVWGFNSEGTSFLNSSLTFTTTGSTAAPVITSINVSNISNTSAAINFNINTSGIASPTSINYGLSATSLTSSVQGPIVTSSAASPQTINLNSLTANTTYYFQVVGTNTNGTTASNVGNFTTLATPPTPTPIYHYKFSGNLNEENGGPALIYEANSGTYSFVIGNTALAFIANQSNLQAPNFSANLPNLPQGASARTVSIRLNIEASETFSLQNNVFAWGTPTANQAYGWSQINATQGRNYFWGSGDYTFSNTINPGTWYIMTFVYDGLDTKIYKNGVFLSSTPKTLNTSGTTFWLGSVLGGTQNYFNGFMDDLQIYNTALTTAQIASLNGAILSNEDFNSNNLKFSLYPNPATDILNIEMESELKSVEIYSLQGQKVLTSNLKEINTSSLASGLYMVRVENVDGAIATKKLAIK